MAAEERVILLGHGSRVVTANEALYAVARDLARALGRPVEAAFLQLSPPSLEEVIGNARAAGCTRFVVVPFFLFPGAHVLEDLPAMIETLSSRDPDLRIALARPLGDHPKVVEAAAARAREAMA